MTIILFLVDNTPSMCVRTKVGTSHLDVARIGVEMFYKSRQKSADGKGDRYILMSYDDPPNNIKSAWKENYATFMSELRNLKPTGEGTLPQALSRALELLNVNRAKSGVDNYAMGRFPFSLEPAVIICITDWLFPELTNKPVNLTCNKFPGSELTIEPYRWDQRIFTFIINIPPYEVPKEPFAPAPENASQLCEMTGGRAIKILSQSALFQSLELLAQRLSVGVNLQFQSYTTGNEGTDLQVSSSLVNFVNVPRSHNKIIEGNWPIPESFWIDKGMLTLPPRTAFPVLKFFLTETDIPTWNEKIPVDYYELEPSPLTRYLLKFNKSDKCWPVSVPGSGPNRKSLLPCGYLRTNDEMTVVFLVITPFNYPESFVFLDSILSDPCSGKMSDLLSYLSKLPIYYFACFRRVLGKLGINIYSESSGLSNTVASSLRRMKMMAKSEYEVTTSLVETRRKTENKPPRRLTVSKSDPTSGFLDFYKIPAGKLSEQLPRLRSNLESVIAGKPSIVEAELQHNKPVVQMGNYQLYSRTMKAQTLRKVEPEPPRLHPFGNPFKLINNIMAEEANESMAGIIKEMKRVRRRSGPLPRDFKISVPYKSPSSDVESLESSSVEEYSWSSEFLERIDEYCERIRQSISPKSDAADTVAVIMEFGVESRNELAFLLAYAAEVGTENSDLCEWIKKLLNCL